MYQPPSNPFERCFPLILFALCLTLSCKKKKHEDLPGPPPPNPPGPVIDTINKQLIVGWWIPAQLTPTGNPEKHNWKRRYLGADGFFYETDPNGDDMGAATGQWKWIGEDSITFHFLTGLQIAQDHKLRIVKLTKDSMWCTLNNINSIHYRLDSLPITSLPISTVAGNGNTGYNGDGIPALNASLGQAISICTDSKGNLYIADDNNRIRKVDTTTGLISTIAGDRGAGFSGDGGNVKDAQINSPRDLHINAAGDLVFLDYYNKCVRKISAATGIITTVAGKQHTGYPPFNGDGGPATEAMLGNPCSVTMDAAGNIYISDNHYNRIRKVNAGNGMITTIAGQGTLGYSGDNGPAVNANIIAGWITVDRTGENLYLGDGNRVRKISLTSGIITTIAGTGTIGYSGEGVPALEAKVCFILGIAVDGEGNVYVGQGQYGQSMQLHRVLKISVSDKKVYTYVGNGGSFMNLVGPYPGDGPHATAYVVAYPRGLHVDALGNLYLADYSNRIRKISK